MGNNEIMTNAKNKTVEETAFIRILITLFLSLPFLNSCAYIVSIQLEILLRGRKTCLKVLASNLRYVNVSLLRS
jgi:hypothetical protein